MGMAHPRCHLLSVHYSERQTRSPAPMLSSYLCLLHKTAQNMFTAFFFPKTLSAGSLIGAQGGTQIWKGCEKLLERIAALAKVFLLVAIFFVLFCFFSTLVHTKCYRVNKTATKAFLVNITSLGLNCERRFELTLKQENRTWLMADVFAC